jgi:hypothetical protein
VHYPALPGCEQPALSKSLHIRAVRGIIEKVRSNLCRKVGNPHFSFMKGVLLGAAFAPIIAYEGDVNAQ